jgi:hypothetical protein
VNSFGSSVSQISAMTSGASPSSLLRAGSDHNIRHLNHLPLPLNHHPPDLMLPESGLMPEHLHVEVFQMPRRFATHHQHISKSFAARKWREAGGLTTQVFLLSMS